MSKTLADEYRQIGRKLTLPKPHAFASVAFNHLCRELKKGETLTFIYGGAAGSRFRFIGNAAELRMIAKAAKNENFKGEFYAVPTERVRG